MEENLKNVFTEELDRMYRNLDLYMRKLDELPRGSLVEKRRGNGTYFYLLYRDGSKVKTTYVKLADLEETKWRIQRRDQLKESIKYLKKKIRDYERILRIK